MAGKLKHDEGPAHRPAKGIKGSRRKLKVPVDYPPFLALQLVFNDYLQEASSDWFKGCRLVSKHFKSAVEAAHTPCTWQLNKERLNNELQTVIRFITSEPRWEWVTKVKVRGGGVRMTQANCELLVAALGAKAWESISLVEVKLIHPFMLPAIIKTSAERGTLRHLSIAHSPVSSAGLHSALSSLGHCLRMLELSPGITFLAQSENDSLVAENYGCKSVRTLILGDAHKAGAARELRKRKQPPRPARIPVTMFPLEPLRTLWLTGLGGLTEDDVIGIFQRTPLLEEFRLFRSLSASLTPAAVVGVFKGLTRHHCPRLVRLSIGRKYDPIGYQDLHGSWLRRFADAHPKLTEVKLFLDGKLSSEHWLYALEKWAPTLEKVTGQFGLEYTEDLDPERQLVLFAKAPRLTELECLGGSYRDDIQWIRYQVPGTFAKLKHVLGDDVRRNHWMCNKYKWLVDEIKYGRRRREQPGGWEPSRTVVEPDVLRVFGLAAIELQSRILCRWVALQKRPVLPRPG
ncbi:hypothetical protein KFL_002050060 [Klebsormidium nitens]|uniref:Uncharacterized protein n=1 Tax=Klebsormidium nitens TaxID=105231 RepID=A0A1Y1I1H6_KLENI|nr:hypothetical protein KFL_002050060 [Klebsormidium nitens]|eukprot:GAQ84764.1 hypothetical protein KFL_002050060 [Klebsormidium nitens]